MTGEYYINFINEVVNDPERPKDVEAVRVKVRETLQYFCNVFPQMDKSKKRDLMNVFQTRDKYFECKIGMVCSQKYAYFYCMNVKEIDVDTFLDKINEIKSKSVSR